MLVPELEQPDGKGASARNAVCSADIWTLQAALPESFCLANELVRGTVRGAVAEPRPSQFLEMQQ